MGELPIWVYPDGCVIDDERLPRTREEFETIGVVYEPLSDIKNEYEIKWGYKSLCYLPKPELSWACCGCTVDCANRRCKIGGEPADN